MRLVAKRKHCGNIVLAKMSLLLLADGEHLVQAGICLPCPQGSYRTKGVHKNCVDCPPGTTTEAASSVKRMQCNTPRCSAGQFLVTAMFVISSCFIIFTLMITVFIFFSFEISKIAAFFIYSSRLYLHNLAIIVLR